MLKFGTVAVVVKTEKKAAKWYREKLGFRLVDQFPHWHTVSPRGSSVLIHLCPDPQRGGGGGRGVCAGAGGGTILGSSGISPPGPRAAPGARPRHSSAGYRASFR